MADSPIVKDGFVRTFRDDTRYAKFAQDIFDLDERLREAYAERYKESRQGPRSKFEERLAEKIQRERILTEGSVRHAIGLVDDYTKDLEDLEKGRAIDRLLQTVTTHTRMVGEQDILSADVALRKLPHIAHKLSGVDLTRWTAIGLQNTSEEKASYFSLDSWSIKVCTGLTIAETGIDHYKESPHSNFSVSSRKEIKDNLARILVNYGMRGVTDDLLDTFTGRPFHDDEKVTALQVYSHVLEIMGGENPHLPKVAHLAAVEVTAWAADSNPMDALIWTYIGLRLTNSEREEYFCLEGKGRKVFDGLLEATKFELPSQLPNAVSTKYKSPSQIKTDVSPTSSITPERREDIEPVQEGPPKSINESTFFESWSGDEPDTPGYNVPEQPPSIPYADPDVKLSKKAEFLLTQDLPEIGADNVLLVEEFFEEGKGMVVEIAAEPERKQKERRRITLRDTISSLTLTQVEGEIPTDDTQREVMYATSIINYVTHLNNGNNPLAESSVLESIRLLSRYGFDDVRGVEIIAGSLESFHSFFPTIGVTNYDSKMSAVLEGTSWIINYGAAFGHSEKEIKTAVTRWSDYITVAPKEFNEEYLAGRNWEGMNFVSNIYRSMRGKKNSNLLQETS